MQLELAKAVRMHRSRLGITQEELAWRAGLHRTYLAGIEAGSRNPSLRSISRLASALDVPLSTLFAESEAEPRPGQPPEDDAAHPGALQRQLADIVLVEDNPRDIELTRRALTKIGLANPLRILRDGAAALDYLLGAVDATDVAERRQPRVILLDLYLPKVDGLEVLRQVKREPRTAMIPVAVLTSSQRGSDVTESRRLGAEAYIVKPVDLHGLSRVVPQLRLRWALLDSSTELLRPHEHPGQPRHA